MFEGLLPIGTVVLLKGSSKRVMIIGVLQNQISGFDSDQIEKIYSVGYQDEEQFSFKTQIDDLWRQLKKSQM